MQHFSRISLIALMLTLVVGVGLGFFIAPKNTLAVTPVIPTENKLSDAQVIEVITNLGKLMTIPTLEQEKPLVAVITNAEQLKKEQGFYSTAESGDLLVLYSSTRRAIIFDSRNNKIKNAGPVILDGAQQ
jgi:hypothetical protein